MPKSSGDAREVVKNATKQAFRNRVTCAAMAWPVVQLFNIKMAASPYGTGISSYKYYSYQCVFSVLVYLRRATSPISAERP